MNHTHQGIVITQTPFRISFFGGGTDFPGYFNRYNGTVIGTAIDKYLYVTINSLERFFEKRIRLAYAIHEMVDRPEELQHPIVRTILTTHPYFSESDFLDIHSFADLPSSSGVGSSSSFAVGMLNALYLLRGVYKTPELIASEAITIEREKLKEAGGWQDQIFAAFGGLNRIHFSNRQFRVEPICLSQAKKTALEDACVFVFTGNLRSSAQIQESLIQITEEERLDHMHEIRLHAEEAFQVLTQTTSTEELISEFGYLLNKTWKSKRYLSEKISNPVIDALYETGMKAGAFGGKLCGAGGGGFLLFIVPKDKKQQVRQALSQCKQLTIKFEEHGSRVIYSKESYISPKQKKESHKAAHLMAL